MRGITLTNGQTALVDDGDYLRLVVMTWGVNRVGGYAQTGIGKKIVRMHRLIMNALDGIEVDHINRNKLACLMIQPKLLGPTTKKR